MMYFENLEVGNLVFLNQYADNPDCHSDGECIEECSCDNECGNDWLTSKYS